MKITIGNSLLNKIDNKMYLVTSVNNTQIILEDIDGNRFIIGNDEQTLSRFRLFNN